MIVVNENYIIEVDQYNYTPKAKVTRTNKKTGEQYEDLEIIGYYSSLQSALHGIIKYQTANSLANEEMSLESAVRCIQTCHKEFTDLLERVVNDGK